MQIIPESLPPDPRPAGLPPYPAPGDREGWDAWWQTYREHSCAADAPVDGLDNHAEVPTGRPDEDDAEWTLQQKIGLPRRPEVLSSDEQRHVLQRLADLEKTCRKRPKFGAAFRSLVRAITKDGA